MSKINEKFEHQEKDRRELAGKLTEAPAKPVIEEEQGRFVIPGTTGRP